MGGGGRPGRPAPAPGGSGSRLPDALGAKTHVWKKRVAELSLSPAQASNNTDRRYGRRSKYLLLHSCETVASPFEGVVGQCVRATLGHHPDPMNAIQTLSKEQLGALL